MATALVNNDHIDIVFIAARMEIMVRNSGTLPQDQVFPTGRDK
jgi:hypothetical protein